MPYARLTAAQLAAYIARCELLQVTDTEEYRAAYTELASREKPTR